MIKTTTSRKFIMFWTGKAYRRVQPSSIAYAERLYAYGTHHTIPKTEWTTIIAPKELSLW